MRKYVNQIIRAHFCLNFKCYFLFDFRTKEAYEYANFGSRMESGEYQFFQATIFALRSFYNSFIPRGSQLSTFQYLLDGCSLTNFFSFSLFFSVRRTDNMLFSSDF